MWLCVLMVVYRWFVCSHFDIRKKVLELFKKIGRDSQHHLEKKDVFSERRLLKVNRKKGYNYNEQFEVTIILYYNHLALVIHQGYFHQNMSITDVCKSTRVMLFGVKEYTHVNSITSTVAAKVPLYQNLFLYL